MKLLQKHVPFMWSADCQAAFRKIKLPAPVLMAPDFLKPFKLMVDASDVRSGAVLLQDGRMVSIIQCATFYASLIDIRGITWLVRKKLYPYCLLYSISMFI